MGEDGHFMVICVLCRNKSLFLIIVYEFTDHVNEMDYTFSIFNSKSTISGL